MTIHYHGTPISPSPYYDFVAGRHFCVSFYWGRPEIKYLLDKAQSLMLDNGAFTAHGRGEVIDWARYYAWVEPLLAHPHWAVIPDVIEGDEAEQDALLAQWPHGRTFGAPVWHMHESLTRLERLCDEYPRVCIGSSKEYWKLGTPEWRARIDEAFDAIREPSGRVSTWVHMMRGMRFVSDYPFASADSTTASKDFRRRLKDGETPAQKLVRVVDAIDRVQSPLRVGALNTFVPPPIARLRRVQT